MAGLSLILASPTFNILNLKGIASAQTLSRKTLNPSLIAAAPGFVLAIVMGWLGARRLA